ncbi:MAG: hypothetical protein MI924_33470, partial [Chloroflexales bacterium]|nr:hypothetical protein [Chloroflexales bacterium]
MRPGAHEMILAQHAGAHGGGAPRAGWRGWPRTQVRGRAPRAGIATPRAVVESATGVGLRRPDVWYLADLSGAARQRPSPPVLSPIVGGGDKLHQEVANLIPNMGAV